MAYEETHTLLSGPDSSVVLTLQYHHRSTTIWQGNKSSMFTSDITIT